MIICGIEIKGSEVIPVFLNTDNNSLIRNKTPKIKVEDDEDAKQLKQALFLLQDVMAANEVTHIAIKQRARKGRMSGSPTGFKLEALIQLIDGVEVSIIKATEVKRMDFKPSDYLIKQKEEQALLTALCELKRQS
ncbi:conserved hypothetical protein [Vibrio chagasii]|nr:conserved hypothetical protein [Vibrio chagasii]